MSPCEGQARAQGMSQSPQRERSSFGLSSPGVSAPCGQTSMQWPHFGKADAAARVPRELGVVVLRFGIAAPAAAQRAALQKDQGADAGPVMDGIFLNVEDLPSRASSSSVGVSSYMRFPESWGVSRARGLMQPPARERQWKKPR